MNLASCSISLSATNKIQQAGIRCFQTGTKAQSNMVLLFIYHQAQNLILELCEDGDVRIVNDAEEEQIIGCFDDSDSEDRRSVPNLFEAATEGRIEICFQNVWGAVYDTNFTNLDAAVACHQLGYSRYGKCFIKFLVLKATLYGNLSL